MKNAMIILFAILFVGCQNFKTRDQIEQEKRDGAPETTQTPAPIPGQDEPKKPEVSEELAQIPESMKAPDIKIGLVFGPSALKAPAQIGILQELTKTKLPIHAVAGMEMGALVAAYYSQRGQSNDAEWKYFKLDEGDLIDKSFIGGKVESRQMTELRAYLNDNFGKAQVQQAEVPFGCPTIEVSEGRSKWLARGQWTDVLMSCMAFPPLFSAYQGHAADTVSYEKVAQQLRAAGANQIILIDVIGSEGSGFDADKLANPNTAVAWGLSQARAQSSLQGYDDIIRVDTKNYDIIDFNSRRDLLRAGKTQGRREADRLIEKYGL